MKTVAVDVGFAQVKSYSGDKGTLIRSVLGKVEQGLGNGRTMATVQTPNNGLTVVGDDVLDFGIVPAHQETPTWFRSARWMDLFYAGLASQYGGSGSVEVVVGLPVRDFARYRKELKELLEGVHKLQYRSKKRQTITIEKCRVVPQGGGVYGQAVAEKPQLDSKLVGICDIGGSTTNLLLMRRGLPVAAQSKSLKAGGWKLAERVQREVSKQLPRYSDFSLPHVSRDVERGYVDLFAGKDITELVALQGAQLGSFIAEHINGLWDGSYTPNTIILAGGGARLAGDTIKSVLEAEGYNDIVQPLEPEFSNVMGYYLS